MAQLVLYPDHPHAFDVWDIDRSTLSLGQPVEREVDGLIALNDGCAEAKYRMPLGEKSQIEICYRIRPFSRVLEIEIELDWQDPETLLKLHFPTGYNCSDARYGLPFGSIRRSQQPGQIHDEAQWEVAGSRWATVSDDGETEGLFVVTRENYGWCCSQGNLGLSIVRSPQPPTRSRIGVETEAGAKDIYSDIGRHSFSLAVGYQTASTSREEQPAALAEALYAPCLALNSQSKSAGFLGLSGGESLIPYWAMPLGEKGWVLRLHETLGRSGEAYINLEAGFNAYRTDVYGNSPENSAPLSLVEFKPYEVISVLITQREI